MLALVVPTLNPGALWVEWIALFSRQVVKPDKVLIIDSGSSDGTVLLSENAGFEVFRIDAHDFNHGGTRQLAVELLPDAEIIIFMTQDALLADVKSLQNIAATFIDERVWAAYGRQLPHKGAGAIATHARMFNYGANSELRSLSDASKLGIKVSFISNSFAAYRRKVLLQVGGFPSNVILGEDQFVGAKIILEGGIIVYCAEATVFHSHDYTFLQEFRRYFDIGVFYERESWIRTSFGRAEGEGWRYVISELKFLQHNCPLLIPSAILRVFLKYFGYRLGRAEAVFPIDIKRYFSMHKLFW